METLPRSPELRFLMSRVRLVVLLLLLTLLPAGAVLAQAAPTVVVNLAQARIEFTSPDHDTLIPVGQVGEGSPMLLSYQAVILLTAADPVTGVVTITSPVIPKANVIVISGVTPNQIFSLTFVQLGITAAALPVCSAIAPATCPSYSVILLATGPSGTTVRSAASESDPFALAARTMPARPAPPSGLKVKAS